MIFCQEWGDSAMIFMRENHRQLPKSDHKIIFHSSQTLFYFWHSMFEHSNSMKTNTAHFATVAKCSLFWPGIFMSCDYRALALWWHFAHCSCMCKLAQLIFTSDYYAQISISHQLVFTLLLKYQFFFISVPNISSDCMVTVTCTYNEPILQLKKSGCWEYTRCNHRHCGIHLDINSSSPGQNGRLFTDGIFRCIFVNEKFCILIKIPLKFAPKGQIENIPALV